MVTLQISLDEEIVDAFRNLANKRGMTVERFRSDGLNQVVIEKSLLSIDAAFQKIFEGSIAANCELLGKLAE